MRTASNMRFLEPREALSPTGVWPTLTEPTIQKNETSGGSSNGGIRYMVGLFLLTHACIHTIIAADAVK